MEASREIDRLSAGSRENRSHPIDTTWAMVKALPSRQRAAVALRFYADLSVTETAEAMGCSAGAVKTHTARALAKLRAALADGGES
jgi:RNA polymerase sigma factor (sigma-70 family)